MRSSINPSVYSFNIDQHPCFSKEAHDRFGRIHLPVAPACNIQCKYCIRKFDCAHESRPGITSTVLSPSEALDRVRSLVSRNEKLTVIGIAGPGDALANDATFETMEAINREFPELILCVSTNGLLLPERLQEIMAVGVRSVTVTVNAVLAETAQKIYSWALYSRKRFTGREAAHIITRNQWTGIDMATEAGLVVKVNTVMIPGINDEEVPLIACLAKMRRAAIHNIMPLIPKAEFENRTRPSHGAITEMRKRCEQFMPQMTHCRQCRADACGMLDDDKDMELETLHARIGEEYCDTVT